MKGAEPTEDELRKTHLLALYGEKKVYTFFGDIWFPSQQKYGGAYLNDGTHWSQGYYWYECLLCGELGIASSDEHSRFPCSCTGTAGEHTHYKNDTPILDASSYTTGPSVKAKRMAILFT